jgi:hypothetical protein
MQAAALEDWLRDRDEVSAPVPLAG